MRQRYMYLTLTKEKEEYVERREGDVCLIHNAWCGEEKVELKIVDNIPRYILGGEMLNLNQCP